MTPAHVLAWIVSFGYVLTFLGLTIRASQLSGGSVWLFDRSQALPAIGFRLAFLALVIWPFTSWGGGMLVPLLALAAAILSAGLALWAQLHMGASWRIGTAEGRIGGIVSTGPFAWSRNPVFMGQVALAWSLVPLGGWIAIAGALLMTASAVVQVRSEEMVLANDPAWVAYAGTTPRWLKRP